MNWSLLRYRALSLNVKKVIELLLPVFSVCFSSLPARSPYAVFEIINEACSVKLKMDEYWPRSLLCVFFTVLDFVSVHKNAKKKNGAPCKGIQDRLGFWIPRRGFQIPGTGFQSFVGGLTWILVSNR